MSYQQQYVQQGFYPQVPIYQQYSQEQGAYVEQTPLIQQPHQHVQHAPQEQAPVTQTTTTIVTKSEKKKKSKACTCMTSLCIAFIAFIISGFAISGFVTGIIAITRTSDHGLLNTRLVGKTPQYGAFVVSYHPFANATVDDNSVVMTAGYGHNITVNKTILSYDNWKPFVTDVNTKSAPYQDSVIIARVITSTYATIQVNTLMNDQKSAGYDNIFTPKSIGLRIARVESIVLLYEEYNYSYYVMFYSTVDNNIYAVYFSMGSNGVTSFQTEQRIATGTGAFAISLPTTRYETLALAVINSNQYTLFLCNADDSVSAGPILCTNINTGYYSKMSLMSGTITQTGVDLFVHDPTSGLRRFNINNYAFGSFSTSLYTVYNPFTSIASPKIAQVGKTQNYVAYSVQSNTVNACAVRASASYNRQASYSFTNCVPTAIATDVLSNSAIQIATAGSQIFFTYQNTQNQMVMKIVGVIGDNGAMLIDNSGETVVFDSTMPLLYDTNNSTVTLLYPTTTLQKSAVTFYSVYGGLYPMGISQARGCRLTYTDQIQKIGVFNNRCGYVFTPGARYYASVDGTLTTSSNGTRVGTALDRTSLYLNIYA